MICSLLSVPRNESTAFDISDDEMSVVIEGDAQAAKALIEADAHKSG